MTDSAPVPEVVAEGLWQSQANHAYQNKRFREALQIIADYARKVEPGDALQTKAMLAVIAMTAEAAIERFEGPFDGS